MLLNIFKWFIYPEHWLLILLPLLCLLIARSLLRRDKDAASKINIEDLLVGEDGRVSKTAAVMLGSFVLTSWIMVFITVMGALTEGYLAIYVGAWVAPTVTKLIKGTPPVAGDQR